MGGFSIWHWFIVVIILTPYIVLIFYRQKQVMLKHNESGLTKQGFFGFSPTYLCFGWFVPLFRSEIGIAALHLLFSIVTFGFWTWIAAFIYNRQYTSRLLTNGWVLSDTSEKEAEARMALGIAA